MEWVLLKHWIIFNLPSFAVQILCCLDAFLLCCSAALWGGSGSGSSHKICRPPGFPWVCGCCHWVSLLLDLALLSSDSWCHHTAWLPTCTLSFSFSLWSDAIFLQPLDIPTFWANENLSLIFECRCVYTSPSLHLSLSSFHPSSHFLPFSSHCLIISVIGRKRKLQCGFSLPC